MAWACLGTRASSCGNGLSVTTKARLLGDSPLARRHLRHESLPTKHHTSPTATAPIAVTGAARRHMSTPSAARAKKLALDRDVLVSVLEASATRRDAQGYLQKYASKKPKPRPKTDAPQFVQGVQQDEEQQPASKEPTNVAIVKLRVPQQLPQDTLDGIAKTLSQLRVLGLLAVIIVDCGIDESRQTFEHEALRLCEAVDSSFGQPGAKLAGNIFVRRPPKHPAALSPIFSDGMRVDDQGLLDRALQHGMIIVVPSLARRDDLSSPQPADAHETVLALTKYLTGMQFEVPDADSVSHGTGETRPRRLASVERVILLDPLGGTPMSGQPNVSHRFINLEQEYSTLIKHLMAPQGSSVSETGQTKLPGPTHAANLSLAKDALSLLPPSSSALITTPLAAANTKPTILPGPSEAALGLSPFGFEQMVTTRKQRNPLLHNLLTDRPVFSPSLPLQRIQDGTHGHPQTAGTSAATLVKRGMPVTTYPDPRVSPWRPPRPGSRRLRLTDTCIDLPRLVYLIEDSFDRKLDVQDYLDRVNDNLAGIIIAGEYEGGAILTWERPGNVDEQEAHGGGRLVPYLDKFAVLKSRQGSAGVADIVFNAMVQDCFPNGVCWRSRKDNPVNKWYFERSTGTSKLSDSNWTMFWTTLGLGSRHPTLRDYETVCRGVQPSWADDKHILD
ncbi:Amino-acid acetyltransferase, mitochondrial [Tolypocladium paradoxum]|uniref:Amino-acid acetyltransferase, mitochondrial n=1 Tax=Tolypocladium paradoxum TaxID=94208 RepID=A0A2S4L2K7_9HYPO|nr:Amino-acid acetyltransferase, mitochondrial [Tolypocladium paradoxum]